MHLNHVSNKLNGNMWCYALISVDTSKLQLKFSYSLSDDFLRLEEMRFTVYCVRENVDEKSWRFGANHRRPIEMVSVLYVICKNI